MSIVVTGAAGFIGSNIVKALNAQGVTDIIAVDDLTQGDKFLNLAQCHLVHYIDKDAFLPLLLAGECGSSITAILHQGACSDTMLCDGKYMLNNNYQYTLTLFKYCQQEKIPFIYASSAAVYGKGSVFREAPTFEAPLNVYGYSKLLFDQVLRQHMTLGLTAQVVGLRYFNVYGPCEQHKGGMASVAFQHFKQYREFGKVKLFSGWDGWGDGMQSRDFVYIEDVVKVNLFFLATTMKSGIFNLGSGRSQPFNDVAVATVNACRRLEGKSALTKDEMVTQGILEYISFPQALKGKYQSFTQADISALRSSGYQEPMLSVGQGVDRYVEWLVNRH